MLQGESKADVIAGNSTLEGNDVIIAWHGRGLDGLTLPMSPLELQRDIPHRVIITSDGWKLNLAVGDFCELYNLNDDPYETTNLFYDEQHGEIAVDLARRIRTWQDQNNDRLALPDIYPGVSATSPACGNQPAPFVQRKGRAQAKRCEPGMSGTTLR